MKSIFIVGLLYLSGLFIGLDDNKDEPIKLDVQKVLEKGHDINLSEYAVSIEYIPFETKSETVLGWVNLFDTDGRNYYCATAHKSDNISVFDENGKYVRKIGNKGRGPKEYQTLTKFSVEKNKYGAVEIGVSGNTECVVYDGNNNYLKGIKFKDLKNSSGNIYLGCAKYNADESYLLLGSALVRPYGTKEMLYTIDRYGNICDSLDLGGTTTYRQSTVIPGYGERKINVLSPSSLYLFDNHLRLFKGSADTLFFLDDELNKTAAFLLSYGKYSEEEDFRIGVDNILETENFLILKYYADLKRFQAICNPIHSDNNARVGLLVYDKKEKTFKALRYNNTFNTLGFVNDLDNGAPFVPQFAKNGKVYQFIDAVKFIDMAQKSSSSKMKEVAAELTEESNPVLVVVTLKRY